MSQVRLLWFANTNLQIYY